MANPAQLVGSVLLVDDEPLFLRALERILRSEGHGLRSACTAREAERALGDGDFDVVLLDQHLGETNGIEVLERLKRARPEVEVVMITGHASVASAVESIRRGALDYLEKPFADPQFVRSAVARAIEKRAARRHLEAAVSSPSVIVGASPEIHGLLCTIARQRDHESSVLIQGEAGTGKEHFATALHAASGRRAAPFVPVDCGAFSEQTLERALFWGGAPGDPGGRGLLEAARGGTLFLDDVNQLTASLQARLLRALQCGEPSATLPQRAPGVRVIAAASLDLAALVEARCFRSDLYFRLAVVRLVLPPLRERSGDIPLLARHFLAKHRRPTSNAAGFEPEALAVLARRPWPGNVRELEHAIEAALTVARGPLIRAGDLPGSAGPSARALDTAGGELPLSFEAYERRLIERALAESGGDATAAARRLGVGRSTLYRKLAKHRLSARRSLPSGSGAYADR